MGSDLIAANHLKSFEESFEPSERQLKEIRNAWLKIAFCVNVLHDLWGLNLILSYKLLVW